jgi:hypothetical protein
MQLAYPPSWWLGLAIAAAIGGLTFAAYRRPLAPLTIRQRAVLACCRALVLAVIVLFMFRPFVLVPARAEDAVIPVLVDVSRSMRLDDSNGETRLARAVAIVRNQLIPDLSKRFVPQIFSVGDRFDRASVDQLSADGRRSDLSGALAAVRERYRGQRVPGIVLLSDGGDTAQVHDEEAGLASGPPVFAIGVGQPDGVRDREIVGIVTGDQRLDQASVDLRVSLVSSGFGRSPFRLRLLANGRELESRRMAPMGDGTPMNEVFTVSPDPTVPSVYTAEIPRDDSELVPENNVRSVLVSPSGRKRRILIIAGAPGFEYSFMRRAWERDSSLEVDSVVREGNNAEGQNTLFVQAAADRTTALTQGFPSRRDDLYAYDGLVFANVEGDFFTQAQLAMASDFVSERGGGLLVVGARSFAQRGLSGTPLEPVLPLEMTDRRGLGRTTTGVPDGLLHNKVAITAEGENHPAMRIGNTLEETRRRWSLLPPLAASALLGGPRPGATVLAVTSAATGGTYPVVAVQQYGRGRSMIFAGEASWRWRMMLPSADRSFEFIWRQAARWLAGPSPDRITIITSENIDAGDTLTIDAEVRDATFAPVGDGSVESQLTGPDGVARPLALRRSSGATGRYVADVRVDQTGLYRVQVDARRDTPIGSATKWVYVGGVDREYADPRLNEPWLRRVARTSGGRYVRAADAAQIAGWLQDATPAQAAPERRDLWHEPWAFVLIVALMSVEWILRRRWGLR